MLATASRFDGSSFDSNAVKPIGANRQSGDGSVELKFPDRSATVRQNVDPSARVASNSMLSPGRKPLPQTDSEQRTMTGGFLGSGREMGSRGQAAPGSIVITGQNGRISNRAGGWRTELCHRDEA
jgi:hypothetical protein